PDIYGYECLNENGWGYRNLKGKVLLNQVYAYVKGLPNGAIIFRVVGGYGLYNSQGKLVVPANYQRIETDRMHSFYFLYN
ncbi:MAG: WG repeat-containing protein, partial [Flexibacteraceae bacterium]